MQTGDIILIPFPFAELTNIKVRPAVIATITKDRFKSRKILGNNFCEIKTTPIAANARMFFQLKLRGNFPLPRNFPQNNFCEIKTTPLS